VQCQVAYIKGGRKAFVVVVVVDLVSVTCRRYNKGSVVAFHTMNAYRGNRDMAPPTLNIGTRGKRVVNFDRFTTGPIE